MIILMIILRWYKYSKMLYVIKHIGKRISSQYNICVVKWNMISVNLTQRHMNTKSSNPFYAIYTVFLPMKVDVTNQTKSFQVIHYWNKNVHVYSSCCFIWITIFFKAKNNKNRYHLPQTNKQTKIACMKTCTYLLTLFTFCIRNIKRYFITMIDLQ